MLAETERFRFETQMIVVDIDVQKLLHERMKNTTFTATTPTESFFRLEFTLPRAGDALPALLHRPTTLFLDEPTIGLDVAMQVTIRDFIRDYNQRHDATVLLTSHYMDDVVALCPRVIVIDKGVLSFDGKLEEPVQLSRAFKDFEAWQASRAEQLVNS